MQKLYKSGGGFRLGERRLNLNGYLQYYVDDMLNSGTYAQIYRNGIIEYVDTKITRERDEVPYLPSMVLVRNVAEVIDISFQFYRQNNIQPPIYLFITLQDVKGYCLPTPKEFNYIWEKFGQPFDQHTIQLGSTHRRYRYAYQVHSENADGCAMECRRVPIL